MSEMNDAIASVHKWVQQTIAFALSIDDAAKTNLPQEITEQRGFRSRTIYEALIKAAQAECGFKVEPQQALTTLVRHTLEWTVQYRQEQTKNKQPPSDGQSAN